MVSWVPFKDSEENLRVVVRGALGNPLGNPVGMLGGSPWLILEGSLRNLSSVTPQDPLGTPYGMLT